MCAYTHIHKTSGRTLNSDSISSASHNSDSISSASYNSDSISSASYTWSEHQGPPKHIQKLNILCLCLMHRARYMAVSVIIQKVIITK